MLFSVIIPTRNRGASLRQVLGSLAETAYEQGDHEIIVVDNASLDDTQAVVAQAAASRPAQSVRYFCEPVPGLLSARHRGALEARGDICAFLDDDVCVERGWLRALKEAFLGPETVLAGGPSRAMFEAGPPEWLTGFYQEDDHARYCSWLSLLDAGDRVKEIDPCYVWGLNFAVRRKALFDLGGFHPDCTPKCLQRFQGDGEGGLSRKIKAAGMKAQYHPGASVRHAVSASRLTVEYFEERAFYQGVCDSYTQIRVRGKAALPKQSWKDPIWTIRRVVGDVIHGRYTTLERIRRRAARAYRAGYEFHQTEVSGDPNLLEWVLRADYWDYQMPRGWERFLVQP